MGTEAIEHCVGREAIEHCVGTEAIEHCVGTEAIEYCVGTEAIEHCVGTEAITDIGKYSSRLPCRPMRCTGTFLPRRQISTGKWCQCFPPRFLPPFP